MEIDTGSNSAAGGFELTRPNGWGFFTLEHALVSLLHDVQWLSRTTRQPSILAQESEGRVIFSISAMCVNCHTQTQWSCIK